MTVLRAHLEHAVQECPGACLAHRNSFVLEGEPLGLVIAQQALVWIGIQPLDASDLVDWLRARILDDPHGLHPLTTKLRDARKMQAYVWRIFSNRAIDMIPNEVGPIPAGAPAPEALVHDDHPVDRLLSIIRTACQIEQRVVLYVAGRLEQYNDPLPVNVDEIRADERAYLGEKWGDYSALLGHRGQQRSRMIGELFDLTPDMLRQVKSDGWRAIYSEGIRRAVAIPTRELTIGMLVALLERGPHAEIPECLSNGRHVVNLPGLIAPNWTSVREALLDGPPIDWNSIGVGIDEVETLSKAGREDLLAAAIGLD